jgi:hypothetical protein
LARSRQLRRSGCCQASAAFCASRKASLAGQPVAPRDQAGRRAGAGKTAENCCAAIALTFDAWELDGRMAAEKNRDCNRESQQPPRSSRDAEGKRFGTEARR